MAGSSFTWTATSSNAWTVGTNWSPLGPPLPADTAIIPTGSIEVNTGTITIADLSLGGSLTAPVTGGKGTLAVRAGGEFLASDAIAVWSRSTLSVDAASSVDIGASGSFVAGSVVIEAGHSLVGSGLVAASVLNNGIVESRGSVASDVFTQGTLELTGSVTGSGTLHLTDTSILRVDGSVAAAQTIDLAGASELILATPGAGLANPLHNLSTGDRLLLNFGTNVAITSAGVTSPGTITITTTVGSYVLSNVSFSGPSQNLSFSTDATTGFGAIAVQPVVINWLGSVSTDFGTGGNWQGGAVPTAANGTNFFTNTTGTVTGTGTAMNAGFNGIGSWTLSGLHLTLAGQPSLPLLPFAAGFNANVKIDNGSTIVAGGGVSIGSSAGATVSVLNGSNVTTLGDTIGGSPGQTGSLNLDGATTSWTQQAGSAVNGSTPGFLNVGFASPSGKLGGGSGFVSITNGATMATGSGANIGFNAGALGSVTINSGGTWTGTSITSGLNGSGTISVASGTLSRRSRNQ